MVLTKEFRIPLPFTLEEYQRGQLYMIAKASREETNGSEGIEVLVNERFDNEMGKGIYTHKVIHLSQRLPAWVRKVFSLDNVLQIEEKSWNIFPYSKTIYKSSLFGDKCLVTVESKHVEDPGTSDNILGLDRSALEHRQVEILDITQDNDDHSNVQLADPKTFKSTKKNRGPLGNDWITTTSPVICAYKYVRVDFQYRAFRSKVENLILDVVKNIYLRTHRQAFVWMDEWIDLTDAELQALEDEIHAHLNTTLNKPVVPTISSVSTTIEQHPPANQHPPATSSTKAISHVEPPIATPSSSPEVSSPTSVAPRETPLPQRRLRGRLRDIKTKLRAKL